MNGHEQPVLLRGHAHHGRPEQRGVRQIERPATLLPHHAAPFALPLRLRQHAHIDLG